MKIPKELFWVLALFLLQQSSGVSASGVDLPLIFTALVSLRTTIPRGAAWGFLMGLIQDLLSAGWIGPNTVAKTMAGLLCSASQWHIYREKVSTQTFLILVATLFHQLIVWLVLKWDGSAPPAGDALVICLKAVFSTTLVGSVACFFVVKFRRRRFDPATA
jgi:rod shape-determining protein MreD